MEQLEGCYGCRSLARRITEADATIAALQARVKELEEWVQDQSTANLETMRHVDEMQSRAMDAESQLTQRTAERDTARRRVDELETREVDVVLLRDDLEQRTAECDALKLVNDTHMKTVMKLSHIVEQQTAELEALKQQLSAAQETILRTYTASAAMDLVGVRAELERVRAERDRLALCGHDHSTQWWQVRYEDLAALVTALPKVEGEISEIICDVWIDDARKSECLPALAALLQHRQGMEG